LSCLWPNTEGTLVAPSPVATSTGGDSLPSLAGAYVFGDFCSGSIWGMRYDGTSVTDSLLLTESGLNITTFGQDLMGEIYVLSRNAGIYRLITPD